MLPPLPVLSDPDVYEQFDDVILTHTCRQIAELRYSQDLVAQIRDHEILSEIATPKLRYFTSTTQDPSGNQGRITDLIKNKTTNKARSRYALFKKDLNLLKP